MFRTFLCPSLGV